jgi:hypothetical protein
MPKYKVDVVAHLTYETTCSSPDLAQHGAWLVVHTGGANLVQVQSAVAREVTLDKQMSRDNLKTLLEMDALRRAGVDEVMGDGLSADEILTHARREVFSVLSAFTRWTPLAWSDLRHAAGCQSRASASAWTRHPVGKEPRPLRESEHATLAGIRAIVATLNEHDWLKWQEESAAVEVRWHEVACPECNQALYRLSALVTVPWVDRTLSREYAL